MLGQKVRENCNYKLFRNLKHIKDMMKIIRQPPQMALALLEKERPELLKSGSQNLMCLKITWGITL